MHPRRFSLSLVMVALLAAFASAADLSKSINAAIRALRGVQNPDGSYGPATAQPLATARVLLAMGSCAEHYVAQDGPFVRNAITALVQQQAADGGFGPADAANRIQVSAEALLALRATAKLGFEKEIAAATKYLSSVDPKAIAKENAADIVRDALNGSTEGYRFAALALPGQKLGADAAWVKPFADSIKDDALSARFKALDSAGVPALAGDLLAWIDATRAQEAAKGPEQAKPLPEMTLRAAPKDDAEKDARVKSALEWLSKQQENGQFKINGGVGDPGVSAIALEAVIRTCDRHKLPRPAWVGAGLDWLASLQKADGAIYITGLKNYLTSVSIGAFAASGDAKYRAAIDKGVAFLKASQLDEEEGYSSETDPYYGGFGYGSAEKPDLSNSQFAIQALKDAGVKADDESFRKAIEFLQRCQNRAESGAAPIGAGDGTVVVPGNDGGAVYRPGNSKAGTETVEGNKVIARSYGSMTYALLKSYLFSGLDAKDDRVKAAFDWICKNFTVDMNPGFQAMAAKDAPYQGLFYYYVTMARALKALEATEITDGDGKKRDWRSELSTMIFRLQSEDGYWKNGRSNRWMEADPILVTSYALLALAEV